MRFFVGTASVLCLIAVWLGGLSEAQEGFTKRDTRGPVTVVVTLIPPPTPGAPIKAKIVLRYALGGA